MPAATRAIRDLVRSGMALGTIAGIAGALVMIGLGEVVGWLGLLTGLATTAVLLLRRFSRALHAQFLLG